MRSAGVDRLRILTPPRAVASSCYNYGVFGLIYVVAGGCEGVGALPRLEGVDGAADGSPQVLDNALGGLAQERLELGERHLDRVEVGAVAREMEQAGSRRLDGGVHGGPLRLPRLSITTISPGANRLGTVIPPRATVSCCSGWQISKLGGVMIGAGRDSTQIAVPR